MNNQGLFTKRASVVGSSVGFAYAMLSEAASRAVSPG